MTADRRVLVALTALLAALAGVLGPSAGRAGAEPLSACGIGAAVVAHRQHLVAQGAVSCGDPADLPASLHVCLQRWRERAFTSVRCRTFRAGNGAVEIAGELRQACRAGAYRALVEGLSAEGARSGVGWSATVRVGCDAHGTTARRTFACGLFAFPPSQVRDRIGDVDASWRCAAHGARLGPVRVRACIQRRTATGTWVDVRCDTQRSADGRSVDADLHAACRPGDYRTVALTRLRRGDRVLVTPFRSPAVEHRCW